MIAAVCKRLGAKTVVISDYSAERLSMAEELGADITVNAAKEDLVKTVKKLSDGRDLIKHLSVSEKKVHSVSCWNV